jgi:hypothetical protein
MPTPIGGGSVRRFGKVTGNTPLLKARSQSDRAGCCRLFAAVAGDGYPSG